MPVTVEGGLADPPRIGLKMRQARLARRLTLRELAETVGCSESLLSKIENEKRVPSLQMLHRILQELNISIGSLFSLPADNVIYRSGQRVVLNLNRGGRTQGQGVQLEALSAGGELLYASIHIIAPGGYSGGNITHQGEEVGYVLQGSVELNIGEDTHVLHPNDSFFFRSDIPHRYRNISDEVAKIIWVNSPPTF